MSCDHPSFLTCDPWRLISVILYMRNSLSSRAVQRRRRRLLQEEDVTLWVYTKTADRHGNMIRWHRSERTEEVNVQCSSVRGVCSHWAVTSDLYTRCRLFVDALLGFLLNSSLLSRVSSVTVIVSLSDSSLATRREEKPATSADSKLWKPQKTYLFMKYSFNNRR